VVLMSFLGITCTPRAPDPNAPDPEENVLSDSAHTLS
jgi:hypothetical protein